MIFVRFKVRFRVRLKTTILRSVSRVWAHRALVLGEFPIRKGPEKGTEGNGT